jgi:predicted lipid-binding transport protein (Tim44 family)
LRPPYQDQSVAGSSFAVTTVTVLTAAVGAILFIGGLMLIAALFVMASLAALLVAVITGAVHAVTPRSPERRNEQRAPHPPVVLDTTARVSRSTSSKIPS